MPGDDDRDEDEPMPDEGPVIDHDDDDGEPPVAGDQALRPPD